ncbi:MAG: hypothetical protein F4Y55_07640 [Gammaproteobacteria bacterium]|nr:hypothetical protein [Gammaproteobacteria bacterium]
MTRSSGALEPDIQRRNRATRSGHGRSAGTIRELYDSALHVASELSILSDDTLLIDSSDRSEFQVVGYVREFRTTIKAQSAPSWVIKHFLSEAPFIHTIGHHLSPPMRGRGLKLEAG